VTWFDRVGVALVALAVVAGPAGAQAEQFDIEVMVSQLGPGPGGVDPRAAKLDAKLQQFRYESLKVLETRHLRLGLDEVGTLSLPNGKQVRVRPLQLTERGLLLAAQVGDFQADLKLPKGHLTVIDAGKHGDGRIVVSFEPSW
jgi:hypothetical protein